MYPLALAFFVVGVIGDAQRNPWEMIEVLLASNVLDYKTPSYLDDFRQLFDDFAERSGIHYDDRNFRLLEAYVNGLPVAKYGLRYTNCEELRQFLSGINLQQRYHLLYASVKCGRMRFSYCMGFACDGYDFSTVSTEDASAPTITHTIPFTYTTTSAKRSKSTSAPTTAHTATTTSSSTSGTTGDDEVPF